MDINSWFADDGIPFEVWNAERLRRTDPAAYETPRESHYVTYYIGVDIGRKRDPSTIAIVERQYDPSGKPHFLVGKLHRFPLRTLYTDLAATLAKTDGQLKQQARLKGKECFTIYALDATGVGAGVAELIFQAMPNATILQCYLTGGIDYTINWDEREVHIPKAQMVSQLLALFDSGRMRISKRSKQLDAMVDELENYELHVSEEGADTYGAKVGKHDDLICALGLACYLSIQVYNDHGGPSVW